MKTLEDFIRPTQKMLFDSLRKTYKEKAVICKGSYVLVKGEAPVMLVAHLDTVHKEPVHDICKSARGNILMSPQGIGGDDRCGVYAITTVYEKAEVKPWLLFTCDEEVGGVGAEKFVRMHEKGKLPKALNKLKLLVEIDRKGKNDAVYYDCDNPELETYITSKGFKTDIGSYSDISSIAPELGVAAVNLSSGYYNAHTLHEYINRRHLNMTVKKVLEIVTEATQPEFPKYEYIENQRFYGRFGKHDWNGWGLTGRDSFGTRSYTVETTKTHTKTTIKDLPATQVDLENFNLDQIPAEIRDDYEQLLDYYTVEELEEFRNEHGDHVIPMICEYELGYSYAGAGKQLYDEDDFIEEEDLYGNKKKAGGSGK